MSPFRHGSLKARQRNVDAVAEPSFRPQNRPLIAAPAVLSVHVLKEHQ
jgi:hypothetical protein